MRVWTADHGRILSDGEVIAVLSYETPYRTLDWTMKEWAAFIVDACNAAEQRQGRQPTDPRDGQLWGTGATMAEELERDRAIVNRMPHNVDSE